MGKAKKNTPPRKQMSEGTAIVMVVLGLTVGGIAIYYLMTWIVNIFFPGLLN